MEIKDYKNAILLALSMDQPRRLLGLMREILSDDMDNINILKQVFKSLEAGDIFRLLEYIRDWNAKSRDSDVAQAVLNVLFKTHSLAHLQVSKSQELEKLVRRQLQSSFKHYYPTPSVIMHELIGWSKRALSWTLF
jgi:U3 small nucleolar RNA-associated protein 13